MKPLVEMQNITKKFSGVTALNNMSFQLLPGEVHVLLGENGAGKSTLMKILSGIYEPTDGKIIVRDKEYSKLTPKDSKEIGISIIYQELSTIDELSIEENIFVGKLPEKKTLGLKVVDYKYMREKAKELLKRVGLNKEPSTLVEELSISEKQQVEIAKSLALDAKIIIMDEPTSSLTIEETKNLFKIIEQLKKENVGIVYISHKLKEIVEVGDRVTILKDGSYVGTRDAKNVTEEELVNMMVGRELRGKYLSENKNGRDSDEVIFEVKNLTRKDNKVQDVSFKLHKGEILGFAGLVGAGRSELMNAIFRADKISSGEIYLFGKKLEINEPYDAIKAGMGLITENRRETGFLKNFNIKENISIVPFLKDSKAKGTFGLVNKELENKYAAEQKKYLNIKCSSVEQNITELSGGNQQKVIIGKWLAAKSDLIIFDEPTKGIDVGAKSEIYLIMRKLAEEGKGVLMVSSELPELLSVCDRIAVFKDGKIKTILTNEEATEEKILLAATSEN
ncbi:D-allose ABC transporter ATP-binding protein AlsA [uncultured Clostridium sp.]|uniref:D-allose ABC transporter ATP-binding protein AlsA n=1 Tax=uncultured Clostridium sp. TaxID=59620 RepID=UPI0028EA7FFC|nr:D-allose ABC transporter ATP-binding protein AlsA [uncultured Clostridium sp.]